MSCMLDGAQVDPGGFLGRQLYNAAVSTKGRKVIGAIISTIARLLSVKPNPELMNFCKVELGHLC